jgi:hypothetical protein
MAYTQSLNYIDYVNQIYRFDKIRPNNKVRAENTTRGIGQIDVGDIDNGTELSHDRRTPIIAKEYYLREGIPIRKERPFLV